MSLEPTVFTGKSTFFSTLEDVNSRHLVTQKTFAGKQRTLTASVDALTAAVAVGKLVGLGRVQKGEIILAGGVLFSSAAGGTAAVDVVVASDNGTVLQTLASNLGVVTAGADTVIAQSATVLGTEVTANGVLALKVAGSQLPIGWTCTLVQPALID